MMMTFGRRKKFFQKSFAKTYQARSTDISLIAQAAIDSTSRVLTSASASDEVSCEFRHASKSGRSLLNPCE